MNRIKIHELTCKYFLFILFISLTSNTIAQEVKKKITIQEKNISIKDAFSKIEQQTGYSIAYEQSQLDLKKKISLSLKNADVDKALSQILKGSKHSFRTKGYHIIIFQIKEKDEKDDKKEKPTQSIRGQIIDEASELPIAYASVGVLGNATMGTITDSLGNFVLKNIPIGRYDIQASYMGYEPRVFNEILVGSAKEVYIKFPLKENSHLLDEVVVTPELNKDQTLNPMVITGGRMVSMEEASRFANGFDDPARLVSAFAGVAGNVGTNAIAIRGNSPQLTQWRLEGVEIPNPTHFADISGLGGGFLSALSTQVMGNFDFYNGAFSAEYNNAMSGVFDTYMRNGNNQNYEHTFQAGILGFDLASEGPISKKRGSSYIFNYRFSTTSLATGNDINMKYQDLSFKLNFPTKKLGTFSVWGLGLLDRNKEKEEDRDKWETQGDRQSGENKLEKMAGGLVHKYMFNPSTYLRSSFAATYSHDRTFANQLTNNESVVPVGDIQNSKWDIVFNSYLNKKISSKHVNRTGISVTGLKYDLDYKVSPDFGLDKPMELISKGDGNSLALSAFSTSVIDISSTLRASIGLTTQYFALNKNWTLEPRASLKWKFKPQQSLAIAYGLHSRREKLDYYFVEQEIDGKIESNKYLNLSKAHHFGLSYDWNITPIHHLKIEPYYQYLFNIPVENGTSFSIINHQEFYLDRILENKGAGKNYGVDITFEQYMNKGFYYMLTGSLFRSKYRGGDNIWRNTRYDRNFSFNILAGKEWMLGKQNQNILGANVRLFFQGGNRYTPLDEDKTNQTHDIEFDETKAFSKQFNPAINGDLSIYYKINKKKISHEFSIKLLNVGFYMGSHFYQYNEVTNTIKKEKSSGMIPNISYKIDF